LISPRLDEDVDHVTVLINGAPQILLPTADLYKDLIQVPRISESRLATLGFGGVPGSELQTPTTNGFIGNLDATLGQQVFDITEAQ
jgi:hypothetical protein